MIYDVTLPLSPTLARWPGDPPVEVASFGGDVKISRWTVGSHAGTHVDSQQHFSAGPQTVDQIDPDILIGPCRLFDMADVSMITAETLTGLTLTGVERVLFRTRNSEHWQTAPATFEDEFVGVDDSAARLLIDMGIKLLGVDGLSVEPFPCTGTVHGMLLGSGIVLVEGLSLHHVPAGDYQLICAPLRLVNSDGAPARVFLTAP